MGRNNRSKRRPQRIKAKFEDRMARRAIYRAVEDSYRADGEVTIHPDGQVVRTFTDPSFEVDRFDAILARALQAT